MKHLLLLLIICYICSCSKSEKIRDKTIIPVAETIGTGKILDLSDYAKSVKYIPLETTDSILIGNTGSVYKQDDIYLIKNYQRGSTTQCLLFDNNGKFIRTIGKIGEGPEEYTSVRSIDIHPKTNTIFMDHHKNCMEYDMNGHIMKKIQLPEYPDKMLSLNIVPIDSSIYLSTLTSPLHRHYRGILFNDKGEEIKLLPNYLEREKTESSGKGEWGSLDGKLYRFKDQIRLWRSWDDTIYTIDNKLNPDIVYRFDFGAYKVPLEWRFSLMRDYDQVNYVFPVAIHESTRYLFLCFQCGRNAPEKFEYEIEAVGQSLRTKRTLVNVDVYGLFDKKTGKLTLLNQPVKHKQLGFRNDLDDGPAFWPKYISSDDEMVTWFSADEFLSLYETLPNPSAELKAFAKQLQPDDNPVLMVVKLK